MLHMTRIIGSVFFTGVVLLLNACSGDSNMVTVTPPVQPRAADTVKTLATLGTGKITNRFTGEISVGTRYAYSSTWGTRAGVRGNTVFIWDLSAAQPVLVDSLQVADAGTLGDVQVVADAQLLVVAVEPGSVGSIVMYDLTNPVKPAFLGRYQTPNTVNGVHTAQVSRVAGRLYAFLCIDPRGPEAAKLVIVDITDPLAPVEKWVTVIGAPFVHDVFVRDGILLTAEWNTGMVAYDIGGGGRGGTITTPVRLGAIPTVGGAVHNVYWLRDSVSGSRYAFVGEEGPGAIGTSSVGDIHVVDVTNWSAMREVAFFRVPGAGTHNFFVDETAGVLYAAYYNEGVRAVNVRGDLSACTTAQRDAATSRCDLALMGRTKGAALTDGSSYVWGVDGASGGSIIASDMLGGIWRLARAAP
jgi:hypothetical protein